jgi:hypothetical protein
MTMQIRHPLREHPLATLVKVNVAVEELLKNKALLPQELYMKLDTFHADLAAAIEDSQ